MYQKYSGREKKRGLFKKMKRNRNLVEYLSERKILIMELTV